MIRDKGLKNIRKFKSGNRGNKETREAEIIRKKLWRNLETRNSDGKSISE